MKPRLLWTVALACGMLAAACSDDGNESDADAVTGEFSEVLFTPSDTADKTVSFAANTSWTATLPSGTDWVEIAPASGEAGDATITVHLKETEAESDRSVTATVTAGTASATFAITQKAPVKASAIGIAVPATHVPLGLSMQLTITVQPADAERETVTWSSSAPDVLEIDETGTVTAQSEGEAVITATMGANHAECTLTACETFTTDGTGRTYFLADLSRISVSGVQNDEGENAYLLNAGFILADDDTLVLGDGEKLTIAGGVELRIFGTVDFTPEHSASIVSADPATAKPIYFTGDLYGGGEFRNVEVVGLPIRCFGTKGLTFENCKFSGIVSTSYGAINLGGCEIVTVSNCEFIENSQPAVSGGSNILSPLVFKNNYLYRNSKTANNRPQINITVAGNNDVVITGNTIIGPAEITTCGGIAVSNLLGLSGTNKVFIENNNISDCRYGITTNGVMDVRIIDNVLENNNQESNPMNGGSGVSIYNSNGGQKVYMSGNTIKGHLWGVTSIGNTAKGTGPTVNMGNLTEGDDYNPGKNVFIDNGNRGVLYDLYNNSPNTVYAQGNTWNVATQDEESIEQVIVHKNDISSLGEVIFMPAAQQ